MKMTTKTLYALIKPYKKPNERSYLLKFLTPVMVVINCLTTMSVTVKLTVIGYFFTFWSFDQHYERRWRIVIYYRAFYLPDGATLFCIINVCRLCCNVKN